MVLGIFIFQEHQRRSLLRDFIVLINTYAWMVIWRYPEIRAQLGISSICNVDLLAPMVRNINVHILHVMVGECDSKENWAKWIYIMESDSIPTTPVLYIFGKSILNSEEVLPLTWVLESLYSLTYGPSLSLLMCFPPLFISFQLLRSLFVLVLFLLSWAHDLPSVLYALPKTLTSNCFYCLLQCNDDRPIIQLCCTVYLYACNRC